MQDVLEQESLEVRSATSSIAPPWAQVIAHDVIGMRIGIVNIFFVGEPGGPWVLIDAGVGNCAKKIMRAAEERFGAGTKPAAIVLTHAHFDHVGALPELAEKWDVPVYAHALEIPYITGKASYPPPDPTVGGGAMAWMSFMYPREGIDLGHRAQMLPEDGAIPHLSGWRAVHTPGHTPGHVSLFREHDRVLIAGDAVITTKQESMLSVLTQKKELRRPPAYFTMNWEQARDSVEKIAALEPQSMGTGHGQPMSGAPLREALHNLADNFTEVGLPAKGIYVEDPALADETGPTHVPLTANITNLKMKWGATAALALAFYIWQRRRTA